MVMVNDLMTTRSSKYLYMTSSKSEVHDRQKISKVTRTYTHKKRFKRYFLRSFRFSTHNFRSHNSLKI